MPPRAAQETSELGDERARRAKHRDGSRDYVEKSRGYHKRLGQGISQEILTSVSMNKVAFLAHGCRYETAAENAAAPPSLTHQAQPVVNYLQAVCYLCMV